MPYFLEMPELLSYLVNHISVLPLTPTTIQNHHQCGASSSTDDPALVQPICAVMRTGSLKTLCIGELSEPDQVLQVLEELPNCTDLRELELGLTVSDEVSHVPFVRNASTV